MVCRSIETSRIRRLISAALSLWQQGKIAPDSWVIDVDQVLENGKRLN